MATVKITDLTDIGTPDPLDVLEIVDVSTNVSKKVKVSELGGSGVATVTGTTVDNTDPLNPIVNVPTQQQVTTAGRIFTETDTGVVYTNEIFSGTGTAKLFLLSILNGVNESVLRFRKDLFNMVIYASTTKYARINFSIFNTWLESVDTTFGTNRINIPYKTVSSGISTFSPPNNKSVGSYNLNLATETKNTNFTAENEQDYTATATLTVTDPTPVTGKGFQVHVIGGTSTIGGVGYTSGALVYRYYDGAVWVSAEVNKSQVANTITDGVITIAPSQNVVFDALALKADKNRIVQTGYFNLTGVTGTQVLASIEIPANTYASTDAFEIILTVKKSVTASAIGFGVYHGTSVNSTTNAISTGVSAPATNRFGALDRMLSLSGGNAYNSLNSGTSIVSYITIPNTQIPTTTTFDPAVSNWITVTVNPTAISESVELLTLTIRPLK